MTLDPVNDVEAYREFARRFMAQVGVTVVTLPEEQRNRFFRMLHDNADVMLAMFPGMELFQYVAGQNPNPVDSPLLQAYQAWASSQP